MSQQPSIISSSNTRNICIVAHVDHGKSSFADSLLASNNIISPRLAGSIRYLDSREDEQERGITMESSAVSLSWRLPKVNVVETSNGTSTNEESSSSKDSIPSPSNQSNSVPKVEMEEYRINLIDTPGHVDFSSEVSTASRLCDGAVVLVDAVEGVCTQTITVLRQTHLSHLKPILVINKLDRLITELKLTPTEAYLHLTRIIEDVNVIVGGFFSSERMEEDWRFRERQELAKKEGGGDSTVEGADAGNGGVVGEEEYEEKDDSNLYFNPTAGNVIFSSAIDGWAFRISRFAQLYAKKLGMSEENLNKCLWGDWYLDPKEKRVVNRRKMELSGRKLKPLFVQFVLENIWGVYDGVVLNNNPIKIDKIVASLSIKVRPQDLRSKDPRNLLLAIFSQWLPLAPSTFRAIIDKIPSPPISQSIRVPRILHPELGSSTTLISPKNQLEKDLYEGSSEKSRMIIGYVSKMFAVKTEELPENQRKALTAEDMRARAKLGREERDRRSKAIADGIEIEGDGKELGGVNNVNTVKVEELSEEEIEKKKHSESLIGFSRLYSGTISLHSTLYALLPKYNTSLSPSHPRNIKYITKIKVTQLYMMMGRELVIVPFVTAGNLFAISGLEGKVARNATICSMGNGVDLEDQVEGEGVREGERECLVNLAGVTSTSAPIVRVALEPKDPSEMSKLVEGLRLLNQADPCVETLVQETGEHVILTAGELHLERCLKDLKDRFARIEITVSPPIVPFRETAVQAPDMAPIKTPNSLRGTIIGSVQSGLVTFNIRAIPLPEIITKFLIKNELNLKKLQRELTRRSNSSSLASGEEEEELLEDSQLNSNDSNDETPAVKFEDFWIKLEELLNSCGKDWVGVMDQIWAFGPKRIGPNLLIDRTEGGLRSLKKKLERQSNLLTSSSTATPARSQTPPPSSSPPSSSSLDTNALTSQLEEDLNPSNTTSNLPLPSIRDLDENLDTAFQLAMNRGPLCAEPVIGMGFFLESVSLNQGELSVEQVRQKWSNARGSLITSASEVFKSSLLDWSPRLKLAMYSCDIQATGEVLGKVYGVVAKRRGRIVSEEMREGTAFFTVRALLPVVESFGFADEIRTRTSGAASPQLVFHGYELLDLDPFWVPTTEEELEDLGDKADKENVARKYMEGVRRRKGMAVEKKVVEHAEKQKTMKNR